MFSTSHTSSQLVKLSKAETLCIFNHHNRCIRHIDSDFDHSCRYQYLDLISSETIHDIVFLCLLHLAMQTGYLDLFSHLFLKCHRIIRNIFRFHRLTFFYHRADYIALPSFCDLLFHEVVGRVAVSDIHHAVFDRQTICRKFIDHRDVQISV